MTTIGYGGVVPITPMGKLTGSLIALMGVALFAIPAGILSFGFYEEFHTHQEKDKPASQPRFQCTLSGVLSDRSVRLGDAPAVSFL